MKKFALRMVAGAAMVLAGLAVGRCGRSDQPVVTVKRPAGTTGPTTQEIQTDDTKDQFAGLERIPMLGLAKARKMPDGQIWDVYPNGLGVQMIKPGPLGIPQTGMRVIVAYVGKIALSGKVFGQASKENPLEFRLASKDTIKGLNMALAQMTVGTKERVWIPANLAYGAQGKPPEIGPNEALIYEIELLRTAGQGVEFPPLATEPAASDVVNSIFDKLSEKAGPATLPAGQKN